MYTDDSDEFVYNYDDYVEDDCKVNNNSPKKTNNKIDFNKIKKKIKKFFGNKFNIILTGISVLILIVGILFIHNLIYGERDYIVYLDVILQIKSR